MLASLLSQFANYDVITLGEAHGRDVDLELRLRLIRHPQLPRDLRLILAEFPDEQLTKAVADANRRRAGIAPLRVVVSASTSAAQIVVEHVRRGEKAIVVYGAGHLWKREGGLTTALQAAGARVLVVQTLAPPTPAAILARLAGAMGRSDFPLLSSLDGAAIGQTGAADVFPGEPLAPSLTLADLADMAVLFGADRARDPNVSGPPSEPVSPNSSLVLSGRVAGLFQRPDSRHVYLILAVETRTGTTERWTVQGESSKQLTDWGWRFEAPRSVRLGEQLRVQVVAAPTGGSRDQVAADAPSQVIAALKAGRPLAYGIEVRLSDGRTMRFGTKR